MPDDYQRCTLLAGSFDYLVQVSLVLAAVGTLIALGAERQLQAHLRGSLNVGVGRGELEAATRQVAAEWGRDALVERSLDRIEVEDDR